MPPIMRSLFGLSCVDEAMPGATDPECCAALAATEQLCGALEKAPALELSRDQKYEHTPSPRPEPAPSAAPAYTPGPRR